MKAQSLIYIFLGILGIVLIVIAFMVLGGAREAEAPTATTAPEENRPTTTNNTVAWGTYSDKIEALSFTFQYPTNASVRRVQTGIYEISYVGPESEANTEINDGYFISLRFATNTDVTSYVATVDTVTAPTSTVVAGYGGVVFQSKSELGDVAVSHVALSPTDGMVIDIAHQTYGDTDGTYAAMVGNIIKTLAFSVVDSSTEQEAPISITEPSANDAVTSPVTVSGEALGYWFFEASAALEVQLTDGTVLGQGNITADGDWMTEDFVPFSGSIEYTYTGDEPAQGKLVFKKANPSGLPEKEESVTVPVTIK